MEPLLWCQDGITGAVVGNDTLKIMTSPGPVGNMAVTSPSVDQLTVTWTPPTPDGVPTSYNVTINDSSSPVVIADNGSPVYNHTFTGLVSDTLYTVSVVAINCAGSSNGTSTCNIKRTRPAPPIRTSMQMVLVFNPNNTLRHLEVSWIPLGGSVSVYTVRVVGDGGTSVGHGSTKCTTSPCLFVQQVNVPATSYTIFVASINGDGEEGPENNITVSGTNTSSSVLNCAISTNTDMGCTFNQSFYCMVCCSTDPSVPPDSSVYNISTTRGTEVTVSLQGLTSGQMYYCKAAATNTNSNNCTGPVVGGVKVFFSFISAGVNPSQMTTHPEDNIDAIIGGVVGSVVGGEEIGVLHRPITQEKRTLQNSLRLTTKSSPDELFCEAVSEQAGQSHCGLGGGYKNIAVCRKTTTERHVPLAVASGTTVQQKTCTYSVPDRSKKVTLTEGGTSGRCAPIGGYDDIEVVRAVKLGGVASEDRMEPSAVATNTQQATYAIPDRTKKQTSFTSSPPSPPPPPPPKEGGAQHSRCAPIGGYDDIVVVRAVKLGGVASGDTMEPSAVATSTQQATYAVPDLTKKASGCGLLLPWLLWIECCEVLSMADTPPPLPAPLKEGDDGLPMAIYALCGPATDDRDEGVAIGCGYLHGLTTSFEGTEHHAILKAQPGKLSQPLVIKLWTTMYAL
eukprot:Em0006g80a